MYLTIQVWHLNQNAYCSHHWACNWQHFWPLLSSHSDDTGIFVSDIIKGSVTDLDGRLLLGDQILSINGEDVRTAMQEHVQILLQVRHIHNHTSEVNTIIDCDWLRYYIGFNFHIYHFSLKSCNGVIHLEVARFKAGLQYSRQSQVNVA